MTEPSDSGPILNRTTLIPVGVAVTIFTVLFGAWGYLETRFNAIDKGVYKVDQRVEKLEGASGDRWTNGDQKLWTARLQILNPDLKIPNGDN